MIRNNDMVIYIRNIYFKCTIYINYIYFIIFLKYHKRKFYWYEVNTNSYAKYKIRVVFFFKFLYKKEKLLLTNGVNKNKKKPTFSTGMSST